MKIVFLDRDGVINKFPGIGFYITHRDEFEFLPGSVEAIRLLSTSGFRVVVISNQGCVSRKQITMHELDLLTQRMRCEVEASGGKIHDVFYCIHQTTDGCLCKKPQTLMFKKAIGKNEVNLKKTYFVGDSREDMEAAHNLGCKGILVLSGRVKKREISKLPVKPFLIQKNLLEAAQWIVSQKS